MNDKEKIEESLEFINSFLTAPDEEWVEEEDPLCY